MGIYYQSNSGNSVDVNKVLTDDTDSTAQYLDDKITVGTGLSKTIEDNAGVKTIKIENTIAEDDKKVLTDSNDTTPGYLLDKIVTTGGVLQTIVDDGLGNRSLQLSRSTSFPSGLQTDNISAISSTYGVNFSKIQTGTIYSPYNNVMIVADGVHSFSMHQPAFKADKYGNQTIGSGAWTVVYYDHEVYDTEGSYDGSYRFTAPAYGYYYFSAGLRYVSGTYNNNYLWLALRLNSNVYYYLDLRVHSYTGIPFLFGTDVLYLNAGDYVDVMTYQNTGSNLSTWTGSSGYLNLFFTGWKVL